jgi:zinc protease
MSGAFESTAESDRMRRLLLAETARRFTLENGLTVVHREDWSAELVSVQLWVRTGSLHEGRWLGSGLSHYLEHMVFKGTGKRGDGEIAREVQEHGGSINAYTTFDRTVYYVNLPSEHAAFGLELLADMIFSPSLTDEDARKERDVILREIDMGRDDPDHRLSRTFFQTAYREHPYRLPVIGSRMLFGSLTGDDLRAYHAARYVAANSVLIVVGAVDEATLQASLEASYAALPERSVVPVPVPSEPVQLARREQRLAGDVTVCRGMLAYGIPGLAHPDAPALDLLASGLGQGQSSHLWRVLRDEKALVHDISAHAWNPGEQGLLWISYYCDPVQRERVEAAILAELATVVEKGLPEPSLEKARRGALVSEINSRKTMAGQASRLGLAEVVVRDLGYAETYHDSLARTSAEAVRRAAARYLVPSRLTLASLNQASSEARLRPPARSREAPPEFSHRCLANGATLIWQRDRRLPKVHLRYSALGGAHYESPGERGITQLLATLLTKDTRWGRAEEIAEAIERVGGQFSEFAGNNAFGLSLEVLSQDLGLARTLLEDAIQDPRFQPEVLEREKSCQIAAIKERWDDNVERAHSLLRQRFFGKHPLAIEADGTLESVPAIGMDALRAHYERLVVGCNAVLVVAGDFDPERDLPLFEAFLLDLPGWSFRAREVPFVPGGAGAFEEFAPREQAIVLLGFGDGGVKAPDELCGQLLHAACADMASTLFRTVRDERNLAYFVSANRMMSLNTGQFVFYGGTHPDTAEEVLAAFHAESERLRTRGLAPDELERARIRLKGQMRMQRQSIGARASAASLNVLYGLPVNDWKDYDARLDRVTLADVRTYAEQHLRADHGVSLVLGPKAAVSA